MSWIFLSISAAFLWSWCNVIDKNVVSKFVKRPIFPLIIWGLISLIVSIIILAIDFSIPPVNLLILNIIAGLLFLVGTWIYFKIIQTSEPSRMIPLFSLNYIWIIILATIFLGEIFNLKIYSGILIIIVGCFLISYRKDLLGIDKRLLVMMSACTFMYSVGSIIQKYLVNFYDYWIVVAYSNILPAIILITYFIYKFSEMRKVDRRAYFWSPLSEGLSTAAFFIFVAAYSIGPLTLVSVVNAVQYIFIFLWAIILSIWFPRILKEEMSKSSVLLKTASIALIVVGVVIISLNSNL